MLVPRRPQRPAACYSHIALASGPSPALTAVVLLGAGRRPPQSCRWRLRGCQPLRHAPSHPCPQVRWQHLSACGTWSHRPTTPQRTSSNTSWAQPHQQQLQQQQAVEPQQRRRQRSQRQQLNSNRTPPSARARCLAAACRLWCGRSRCPSCATRRRLRPQCRQSSRRCRRSALRCLGRWPQLAAVWEVTGRRGGRLLQARQRRRLRQSSHTTWLCWRHPG